MHGGDGKQTIRETPAGLLDGLEVTGLGQALARFERQDADGRSPRTMAACAALRTETLAALGAAACQQAAPALGRHASAEPVRAVTVQIAGVECAFHGGDSKKGAKTITWGFAKGGKGTRTPPTCQ